MLLVWFWAGFSLVSSISYKSLCLFLLLLYIWYLCFVFFSEFLVFFNLFSSVNQIWKTLGSWGSVAGMVAPEIQIIIRFCLCVIRFHWWKIRKNYKLVERFAHRNISWNKLKQPKSCGIKSNMQTAAICWNIFHEIECKRAGNPM